MTVVLNSESKRNPVSSAVLLSLLQRHINRNNKRGKNSGFLQFSFPQNEIECNWSVILCGTPRYM